MSDMKSARILCIEDDDGQARLLQKRLQRDGASVDLAMSIEQGLALLAHKEYDLIVVDYRMPGSSGIHLIRTLRTQGKNCAVVMLTGNGNEKVAVEAMKAGASDYLVKDPDMEYLELLPIIIDQVMQQEQLLKERVRMRAEVKESEERYRKLVELSLDGIAINAAGRFSYINPAGRTILGASRDEELVGKPVLDFVHPDFRQIMAERLALLGRERAELPLVEEKFIRLDGREIDVEVMALPFTFRKEPAIEMVFRDVTEQKLAHRRLEHLAKFDPLTSLPNRALFFDRMNSLLDNGKRYPLILALLFLDLDGFKEVNDRYGHDAGDQLLQQVAVRLTGCLREADSVARIGGDEFAIILSRISEQADAALVAKKIVASVAAPFTVGTRICSIGVSIGISVFPVNGMDPDSLLRAADTAMYGAKKSGRNSFRFSDGSYG